MPKLTIFFTAVFKECTPLLVTSILATSIYTNNCQAYKSTINNHTKSEVRLSLWYDGLDFDRQILSKKAIALPEELSEIIKKNYNQPRK